MAVEIGKKILNQSNGHELIDGEEALAAVVQPPGAALNEKETAA